MYLYNFYIVEDAYRFPYITSKILSTLRGQIVPTFHKRVNKINKGLEGNFGTEVSDAKYSAVCCFCTNDSKAKLNTKPTNNIHFIRARAWCTGKTQRNWKEREVGGGIRMGNTCTSMADSCQCMTKPTEML